MKLVLIEWTNIPLCPTGWTDLDEFAPEVVLYHSVGWLARETEEYKVVVPHLAVRGWDAQGTAGLTIPTKSIKKISRLTWPWTGKQTKNRKRTKK